MDPITTHQKDQLLDHFFHTMSMEARLRVMRELPEAYNAYHGSEIIKVIRVSDGTEIR